MTVLLAGRAAEELCLGDVSTGAADDLLRATRIARSMIVQYGMDPTLGPQSLDAPDAPEPLPLPMAMRPTPQPSDATAREIDCAVRGLLEEARAHSAQILREQRSRLERGAARLLERETLVYEELRALCEEIPREPPATSAPVVIGSV
jgi:cell division protease FtsH